MVSLRGIRIEDKKIEAVKQWPEPHSVRDIQVFLGFANFYCRFIQEFSWIAAPLISMLKTSGSTEPLTRPGEGAVEVVGDSRAGRDGIDGSGMGDVEVDGGEVEVDEVGKKGRKTSKSKNLSKSKKVVRPSDFLTPGAKLVFTELRQVFLKASILQHFDPERQIRIETMHQAMLLVESSVS